MNQDRPTVALVSGHWGQNIGNAFFNIGGKYILEQALPNHRVEYIQDQPGYRTFHNQSKGNPSHDFGLLKYLDIDYIVLQGPLLTGSFRPLWEETFRAYQARGVKIILLSAGFFKYTPEEIAAARSFLKEFPPYLISTRDHKTFEHVKDLSERVYSGIDSALFVPEVYKPFKLVAPPYITVNFDRRPEPAITLAQHKQGLPSTVEESFEALGQHWGLTFPGLQARFAKSGKARAYIGAALDRRKLPAEIAGHVVVRPDHRHWPHMTYKVYQQPNGMSSDEPFTYFTIYADTTLTLSDRVHACVATLAYGKPAMMFSYSARSALFDRLGLEDIRKRPMTLDQTWLANERAAEIAFLKQALA
jgi:Polysaccharide pyruvyl transferase